MKKIFGTLAIAALAFGMYSCNNQPQANDTNASSGKGGAAASASGQKIAYIEFDSISSQYTFAKDVKKILEEKSKNAEKTIGAKEQEFSQAYSSFQQKGQSNKFASQAEFEQAQARLAKLQQDGQALTARLQGELQSDTEKYLKAVSDSVENYIKRFNKDKKYSMILVKSGNNILGADPSLNITNEIVKGLNKDYKGMNKK